MEQNQFVELYRRLLAGEKPEALAKEFPIKLKKGADKHGPLTIICDRITGDRILICRPVRIVRKRGKRYGPHAVTRAKRRRA
ncbi:MAG TPA: hypothetical protein VEJ47_21050 [Candidatus Eremiobacteraceae bacterium]|nr:hypothetical protein [Candidatus Eremiobacteraceae bacterium]